VSSKKPIIEIENLTKTFKSLVAVNDLSLSINEGEFVALLGPNGAGKTTLVEMIEGIQGPTAGDIKISGMSWKDNEDALRKMIGLSLQETRFLDKLTVYEILYLFAGFYNKSRQDALDMLIKIGLADKKNDYTMNLSGGQKQKLSLGIALINDPKIIILDEPTTGLDPHARRELWQILKDLRKTNTTMILTTHYMEEAELLCERVVIMYKGKILADGKLDRLLKFYGAKELIELRTRVKTLPSFISDNKKIKEIIHDKKEKRARLFVDNIADVLPDLLKKAESKKFIIEDLQCRKMNLDDLFISLTGRHLHE